MFSRIHLPRFTGDVRAGLLVSVRMLACVSTPPRFGRRRNRHAAELVAFDARHAVVLRQPLVDEREAAIEKIEHAAVFANDRPREQFRLAAHVGFELAASKSGNISGSGVTPSSSRRLSHCVAKFWTRASLLGSASIRRTCCSMHGWIAQLLPASARANSSSSGMLLQRKYESREASSKSADVAIALAAASRPGTGNAAKRAPPSGRLACPARTSRLASRPPRRGPQNARLPRRSPAGGRPGSRAAAGWFSRPRRP